MSGISPKFPLTYSGVDGFYTLNKSFSEAIQQNLKNLVLTSPGERIMDIQFGVGLYNYLFELDGFEVREELAERINEQVARYLPYVQIDGLRFYSDEEDSYNEIQSNFLGLIINYSIPSLGVSEELEILISDF